MAPRCACCGCDADDGARAHLLQAALGDDDLDRAIALGLLEDSPACATCSDDCRARLVAVRVARQRALAARERFRARALRLQRRERQREARREPPAAIADPGTAAAMPSLPPAAAAALARAKAKAAGRKP